MKYPKIMEVKTKLPAISFIESLIVIEFFIGKYYKGMRRPSFFM